eukprot:GHVS01080581.1.p1 GENE.GHVS01080581.1~~GHVS01080581.1.p1  ORF type:complete len:622 (-),score=158.15 GHVS01080581.1:338-2203(-)
MKSFGFTFYSTALLVFLASYVRPSYSVLFRPANFKRFAPTAFSDSHEIFSAPPPLLLSAASSPPSPDDNLFSNATEDKHDHKEDMVFDDTTEQIVVIVDAPFVSSSTANATVVGGNGTPLGGNGTLLGGNGTVRGGNGTVLGGNGSSSDGKKRWGLCELYADTAEVIDKVSTLLESSQGFISSGISGGHPNGASRGRGTFMSRQGRLQTNTPTRLPATRASSFAAFSNLSSSSSSSSCSSSSSSSSSSSCSVPPSLAKLYNDLSTVLFSSSASLPPLLYKAAMSVPSSPSSSSAAPPKASSSTSITSSSSPMVESVKTLAFLGLWYAGNVLYNIENKKALNIFPLPATVATIQMLLGIPIFVLPWMLGIRRPPTLHKGFTFSSLKPFLTQAIWHSANHLSAVVALGAGAISFVHIVKAAEPAFTAFLSTLTGSKPLSAATYISLVPVILGVSLASLKELSFTWTALVGATMSNVGSAMRGIEAKKTLSNPTAIGHNLTAPNVYALLTACAATMLAPVALLDCKNWRPVYEQAVANGHSPMDIAKHILASGWWYYLYNEVAFVALQRLNPVSHAVANTVKRVFLILTSVLVFGSKFTAVGAGGSAMAVGGTLLYSLCKQKFG